MFVACNSVYTQLKEIKLLVIIVRLKALLVWKIFFLEVGGFCGSREGSPDSPVCVYISSSGSMNIDVTTTLVGRLPAVGHPSWSCGGRARSVGPPS